jgi:hypothetical protein
MNNIHNYLKTNEFIYKISISEGRQSISNMTTSIFTSFKGETLFIATQHMHDIHYIKGNKNFHTYMDQWSRLQAPLKYIHQRCHDSHSHISCSRWVSRNLEYYFGTNKSHPADTRRSFLCRHPCPPHNWTRPLENHPEQLWSRTMVDSQILRREITDRKVRIW